MWSIRLWDVPTPVINLAIERNVIKIAITDSWIRSHYALITLVKTIRRKAKVNLTLEATVRVINTSVEETIRGVEIVIVEGLIAVVIHASLIRAAINVTAVIIVVITIFTVAIAGEF